MRILSENDEYYCARLDSGDPAVNEREFALFLRGQQACYLDKIAHPDVDVPDPVQRFREITEAGETHWRYTFEDPSEASFLLFKRHEDGTADEIAGRFSVTLPDEHNCYRHAAFHNMHIMHAHRNRGLTQLLYDAGKIVMREVGETEAHVVIKCQNEFSLRAAERNGFERYDQLGDEVILFYTTVPENL